MSEANETAQLVWYHIGEANETAQLVRYLGSISGYQTVIRNCAWGLWS